jgi:hypothetical protein
MVAASSIMKKNATLTKQVQDEATAQFDFWTTS